MTLRERVIVSAYTGFLMVQGEELKYLYEYAEKVTGGRAGKQWILQKKNYCASVQSRISLNYARGGSENEHSGE